MVEVSADSATSPVRAAGRLLLQAGVVALVVWLTLRLLGGIDWRQLGERLAEADWAWVTAGALALFARFVVWDLRWRRAFARARQVPGVVETFAGLMAAVFVNLVTPSARVAGGLMRARALTRGRRHPFGEVYGVVLFDQVAHQAVMVSLTWGGLALLAWILGRHSLAVVAVVAMAIAVAGVATWLSRGGISWVTARAARLAERLERRGGRLVGVVGHGRDAAQVLGRLLRSSRLVEEAIVLTLAFVAFAILGQWALFRAVGVVPPLTVVALGVVLGTAAGAVTGTPGGLGTTEAGTILAFVTLGIEEVDAVAATVLARGFHYAWVIALGLPAFVALELRRRRPRGEARRAAAEGRRMRS